MANFSSFINNNKKKDKPKVKNKIFFVKSRKTLSIALFIIVIIALTRVSFIGGTFLDSFVFGLLFGYMRYGFYAWAIINFVLQIFQIQNFFVLYKANKLLLLTLIFGSAWIYAVTYGINNHNIFSFEHVWHNFFQYIKTAWLNLSNIASKNYSDFPTGIVGALLISIFFAIPNPFIAQSLFWIFTIVIYLIYLGYFIFKDISFFPKLIYATVYISIGYIAVQTLNLFWKIKIYFARRSLKLKKNTVGSNFFSHADWSFSNVNDEKKYVNFQSNINSFNTKTHEIFNTLVFKKYLKDREKLIPSKSKNVVNKKILDDNINIKVIPQDISPQNSYWNEKILKILPSINSNIQRIKNNKVNFNINNLVSDDKNNENDFHLENYIKNKKHKLFNVLNDFNIDCNIIATNVFGKIIQFEVSLNTNIKINKINELKDNLKYSLAEKYLNILSPIPGKSTIGIEIFNPFSRNVNFVDALKKSFEKYSRIDLKNKMIIGQNISNEIYYQDLTKFSHLLLSGVTGSGKSVELNNIILSTILFNEPWEVNLILIDLKGIELLAYKNIPHLLMPIVKQRENINYIFEYLINEMKARYKILNFFNVKNIDQYNKKQFDKKFYLPRILIIIDEYADLMMYNKKDIEKYIVRLTHLSRASGIHIILSTQRPSRDIITGLIKSNMPYRLSLRCSSAIDSRIILDDNGAEKLLKNGDMLYKTPEDSSMLRLQSCFINEKIVEEICTYYCKNYNVVFDQELIKHYNENNNSNDDIEYENNNKGDESLTIIEDIISNDDNINLYKIKKYTKLSNDEIFLKLLQIYNSKKLDNNDVLKKYLEKNNVLK